MVRRCDTVRTHWQYAFNVARRCDIHTRINNKITVIKLEFVIKVDTSTSLLIICLLWIGIFVPLLCKANLRNSRCQKSRKPFNVRKMPGLGHTHINHSLFLSLSSHCLKWMSNLFLLYCNWMQSWPALKEIKHEFYLHNIVLRHLWKLVGMILKKKLIRRRYCLCYMTFHFIFINLSL